MSVVLISFLVGLVVGFLAKDVLSLYLDKMWRDRQGGDD